MKLLAGTSGFAFKEWKGPFYPVDLKDDDMLGFYSSRFSTVEINNTFYRLPRQHVLRDWAAQVPESFTFALKASQQITHFGRLTAQSKTALDILLLNTQVLGARLGPVLFQLPPNMEKDLERLAGFLDWLPRDRRFTLEFRNDAWWSDDVLDAMRSRDIAFCITDQPDFGAPVISTATWGYLRLHRRDYTDASLGDWAAQIHEQPWTEVYVYFKHDEGAGSGPPAVESFVKHFEA